MATALPAAEMEMAMALLLAALLLAALLLTALGAAHNEVTVVRVRRPIRAGEALDLAPAEVAPSAVMMRQLPHLRIRLRPR